MGSRWLGMVLCAIAALGAGPRIEYGLSKLPKGLKVDAQTVKGLDQGPEGYRIDARPHGSFLIQGADDSGTMYGCLELARLARSGDIPKNLHLASAPAFKLRGPCIGMQKPYILPGRKVYEYPYTPELFRFFYDKAQWTEYLDFLAVNRFNTLYLWNGHPFASLVRLKDYPEAIEVSPEAFEKNVEIYRWLASECDRRGIWLVQMFYNIFLSKPLAEKHNLPTQLSAPNDLAGDYTRKSIAEFMKQYPNVGLMVCLGEALQGQENQTQWLVQTIIPGIKDGMAAAGLKDEPPVVIRTHATDLRKAMPEALKHYRNLHTEAKFNGESLTTWEPRGKWQGIHQAMSQLGSTHLINVHILANLEPFRYGAPRFIQKSVLAGRDRLGAHGLHLYPLCYWNWPDSADEPPLKQIERDWIWFEAWARYAWNPDIDAKADRAYWIERLCEIYGNKDAGELILDAYNDSGEVAPRLIRRFGITEGNRQTLSLGMTLDELVNPSRYRALVDLWESQSPPGERLQEYVDREWNKQPHVGETPPQIIREVIEFSGKAKKSLDAAAPLVTKNKEEFERLRNDIHAISAMARNYGAKANAAICVLRYQHSKEASDMQQAERHLAESLEHFRELVKLTTGTYRFANSMQTSQRKIPVPGGVEGRPANYHWSQLLPVYEKELADFRAQPAAAEALAKASFKTSGEIYALHPGEKVFSDRDFVIESVAPQLAELVGIRTSMDKPQPVEIETERPVQVLIGFVKSNEAQWRKPPSLETDALAAEHGGTEVFIADGVKVRGLPPVDVHALHYPAGRHTLDPRGEGAYLILGVISQP